MPTRTLLPAISMMWILVSSPSMIRSPGRRVMMSTAFLLGTEGGKGEYGTGLGDDLLCGGDLLEQRGPDGRARRLVDHLVTAAACYQDRRAEVRPELLDRLTGADGHVHVGLGRVGHADPLGLGVRDLHLVRGEEEPRVGDGDRERRVVERVQPQERGRLLAGDERVAGPAQADQAVREVEHRLVRHLKGAEAGALDVHWHLPPPSRAT